MNRILTILFLLSIPLYSMEIRLNGQLYENLTEESLRDLSYSLPDSPFEGIYLYELLPLMEETHSFRFISKDFTMDTDPEESIFITDEENGFFLQNNSIGKIPLPELVEITGIPTTAEKILLWFDEEDPALIREIELFARLHHLEFDYRVEKNLRSLLEYNTFNDTIIPDLIIYSDKKLNSLTPLLSTLPEDFYTRSDQFKAVPFKLSRQIYLEGSSGGENQILTSDFGDLYNFYPLYSRFAEGEEFSIDHNAVKESLSYITSLYEESLYRLSPDAHRDFIEGKADKIYTSSTILGELNSTPVVSENRSLPHMRGKNPPPLLNYRLLSLPERLKNRTVSLSLIRFLSDFGVQQRIDPQTGFLPIDRRTYPLLKESISKDLLMEDLENAISLAPSDWADKLSFVLPRIYRLVISGRLSINQGIAEMAEYLED